MRTLSKLEQEAIRVDRMIRKKEKQVEKAALCLQLLQSELERLKIRRKDLPKI